MKSCTYLTIGLLIIDIGAISYVHINSVNRFIGFIVLLLGNCIGSLLMRYSHKLDLEEKNNGIR